MFSATVERTRKGLHLLNKNILNICIPMFIHIKITRVKYTIQSCKLQDIIDLQPDLPEQYSS